MNPGGGMVSDQQLVYLMATGESEYWVSEISVVKGGQS